VVRATEWIPRLPAVPTDRRMLTRLYTYRTYMHTNVVTDASRAIMQPHGGSWSDDTRTAAAFTTDHMGDVADLDRGLCGPHRFRSAHIVRVTEDFQRFLGPLRKHTVRTTYFVETWNLAVYSDAVEAAARAGHEVAWHVLCRKQGCYKGIGVHARRRN